MNNLLESQNKSRFPGGRVKWYVLGALTVLLIVFQIIEKQAGVGHSPRQIEYSNGMKTPASPNDSALLLSMYDKLNAIYDQINHYRIDTLTEFNAIPANAIPETMHTKMITYELLDYAFDSLKAESRKAGSYKSGFGYDSFFYNINSTMGNGDFVEDFSTLEFQKGFAGDARYMLDEKYIMVLATYELIQPRINPDGSTFESGSYYGAVMVFDITKTGLVAYEQFVTGNSEEVTRNKYVKGNTDKSLKENLEQNIQVHVNDISRKFFGRALWPVNYS